MATGGSFTSGSEHQGNHIASIASLLHRTFSPSLGQKPGGCCDDYTRLKCPAQGAWRGGLTNKPSKQARRGFYFPSPLPIQTTLSTHHVSSSTGSPHFPPPAGPFFGTRFFFLQAFRGGLFSFLLSSFAAFFASLARPAVVCFAGRKRERCVAACLDYFLFRMSNQSSSKKTTPFLWRARPKLHTHSLCCSPHKGSFL